MISPQRLDPLSLRLFDAVAETGSLGAACRRLNLAPAAGSRRLAMLEAEVGLPLLERHSRGMRLTPAGETLRKGWRGVETAMARLALELDDMAGGVDAHLRVAASASVLLLLPLDVLGGFLRREPKVRLDLREMPSGEALLALRRGDVELALVDAISLAGGDLAQRFLCSDELVAVVPPGHRLAGRGAVSFRDMLDDDLVGYVDGSALQSTMRRAADEAGLALRMRVQAQGMQTVAGFVAAGFGAALLPRVLAERHAAEMGLTVLNLQDAWAQRRHVIAARGEFSALLPAARRFVEVIASTGTERESLRVARWQA
ncbi:LysR family transcriptional regulator [Roseomonas xinghualingensis]|uniref:LysR family transcriptional regulator n=1 Tax=Roseomonas xinghualingensis TaxID=2986475 RepID=UPI0021F10ABA|nr:LysR family transcriptional regulator [Roseomonas sp. SXEYE001]MCV4206522.1 LysR family transcriptional regulator [Roseomonas sp. SXEYE001]